MKPDWVDDKDTEKVDKWEDLEEIAQGRLGLKVKDDQGNVKEEVRVTRVKGKGTVATYKEKQGSRKNVQKAGSPSWAVKRKDKLRPE